MASSTVPARVAGAVAFALLLPAAAAPQPDASKATSGLPTAIVLAPAGEPGAPLVVRGVLFKPDGTTPAAGVTIEVHHTDAEGWYHKASRNRERARLFGLLQTDALGRFEIRTIQPGKYPEGRNPAHIHFKFFGRGVDEHLSELFFAGDPDLPPAGRVPRSGKWNAVCSPARDSTGVLQCAYNVRLE